jgi:monoamine oxidase
MRGLVIGELGLTVVYCPAAEQQNSKQASQDFECKKNKGTCVRVWFAGEHASPWNGWMQGAIASGIRTAKEINAEFQRASA